MSAELIPFSFDSFMLTVMDDMTPEKAQQIKEDFHLAADVMVFCQTKKMEALRGELSPEDRFKLKYALAMIRDEHAIG